MWSTWETNTKKSYNLPSARAARIAGRPSPSAELLGLDVGMGDFIALGGWIRIEGHDPVGRRGDGGWAYASAPSIFVGVRLSRSFSRNIWSAAAG